jgi:hypothetical protein
MPCTSDIPMLLSSHTSGWGTVDVGLPTAVEAEAIIGKSLSAPRTFRLVSKRMSQDRKGRRWLRWQGKISRFLHQDISMFMPQ